MFWQWLATRLGLKPRSLGERGERLAARFLEDRGYTIVARGHRDHVGEIDLIAVGWADRGVHRSEDPRLHSARPP